jgi:DNA helicase II / ATP-dependent DNA helicase PcrA
MIRCGNCDGEHTSVAEVRACHQGTPAATTISRPDRVEEATHSHVTTHASAPTASSPTAGVRRPAPAHGWAGPDELGRWLVVSPGAHVDPPWETAPRFTVDAAALRDPSDLLDELLPLWFARSRVVIELLAQLDPLDGASTDEVEHTAPWYLDPTFTFMRERLAHVVWTNSVDGRVANEPRWHWDEMAAGASSDAALDGDGVWYDGGPLARPDDGLVVVHRIALERGLLTPLGVEPPRANLAADQLAAVGHPGSSARIIAPAGSGKTRVLTERARHLLREWNVPPSAMALVAFNVRAADEIRERTTDLADLQIRTLNALALSIVTRIAGRRVTTIDEREVRRILDGLVTFPRKTNTDPAQAWLDAMSLVRLGLRPPADVEALFDGDVDGFAEVFPRYRETLAERNAVDFDEQIVAAIVTLLTDPVARAKAQRMARVLLVDEFQDLAPAHLLLVRLLSSPDLSVFGVGDDDQTIYGYAGATPEWLIGFDRVFPGAGDHPLHVNYRCPPAIVRAASSVLSYNRRRVQKTITTPEGRNDEASALAVVREDDTTLAAVRAVDEFITDGASPADIAVLARVNAALAPVQIALRHAGLPTLSAVNERYLERTGVRSGLAWLRIATDVDKLRPADLDATIRRPSRGLSGRVVEWVAESKNMAALNRLAGRLTNERDTDKVMAYIGDVQQLARLAKGGGSTAALLEYVRNRVGLDDAMAKLDRSRADAQASHMDDLDALTSLARLHPDPSTFALWLRDELARPSDPDGITLASIHKVKGREWPFVVVHDVREGVLPHRLAEDREEERRIFHVGITRASQRAVVITDAVASSSFVAEMTEVYVAPPPGSATASRVVSSRRPNDSTTSSTGDDGLRELLRSWRKDRADTDSVPAYVVFTNVTLDALVDIAPTTLDDLRRIPGIGPAKRERYGEAIVALIRDYAP